MFFHYRQSSDPQKVDIGQTCHYLLICHVSLLWGGKVDLLPPPSFYRRRLLDHESGASAQAHWLRKSAVGGGVKT